MPKDSFDSWDAMADYFSSHYMVIQDPNQAPSRSKRGSSISKGKGTTGSPLTKVEIRNRVKELLSEIRAACSAPPWNLRGIISDATIKIEDQPDGSIVVTVPFNSKAYKQNIVKSQSHYSFIPILMSRGWSVHGAQESYNPDPSYHGNATWEVKRHRDVYGGTNNKKVAVWQYGRPSFEYFVGTGELDRIIENFNAKYAKDGFFAMLDYDEDTLGWIPGHYIKSL